ncbi:MAG: hypothetical protein NTY19_08545 [Planctomycetota bacterium]|nr:hypothetical protein [Planctomycetota bacterium]
MFFDTPEFEVLMLGPSNVGKTSLLATMNHELARASRLGFRLHPTDDEGGDLALVKSFNALAEVVRLKDYSQVPGLLRGDMTFSKYRFELLREGNVKCNLVFWDCRGGTVYDSGAEGAELKQRIADAHIIFNVVDATVLMEGDEFLSDEYNGHTRIANLLQDLDGDQGRLVVFVLTKCERWWKRGKNPSASREGRKLIRRFEDRHLAVLNVIEEGNFLGMLMPVATLGCVEFSRVELDAEGKQRFVFVKKPRADFCPWDVDQPLRCAMAFALAEAKRGNGFVRRLWEVVFGDGGFGEALTRFTKGVRPARRYGDESLLEL